ncbi:DUF4199 domain-containing protein [Flavobacterium sp. CBA20B-1]|uniref:DUF4199 domain-containing protein n=1 Tax=unclassified Flavobacterium TaxID=196869 RepID=UPI0022244D1A|nr:MULTISPECIES: DUF4199 domain-containing protein [unclassified Flavobacterium]WCM42571.1 DUF4199 domain-containing protein [Flavobacterium sp. CBA20B-1]
MNIISKKTGLTFGFILMAYYVLVNLIVFFADYTLFVKSYLTIINIVVVLILGISCIWITKKRLKNRITFKEGFTAFFIMIVIGFLANYIIQYILFNFVNPEAKIVNNQLMIEMTQKIGKDLNLSEAEINEKISIVNNNADENFSLKTLFFNYAQTVLGASIAGLLIALTFKNKSEVSAQTNQ